MSVLYLRNKNTGQFEPIHTINGQTPYIGDNGNWWIGDYDTGKSSRGFVPTVNGETADETGNISVDVGVKTINGSAPDENGNIELILDTSDLESDIKIEGNEESVFVLENTDIDPILSEAGKVADAKAVGDKFESLAVENLLINSDFRNPVNQRRAGGSYDPWGGYTIDRWLAYSNGATLEITNNGIILLNSIYQPISSENVAKYNGKILTFAVKINGAIYAATGTVSQIGSWNNVARVDTPYGYIQIETENNNEMFCIINNNINAALLEWAALYEGTYTANTLPPYIPKGYAEELVACQVADTSELTANNSEKLGGNPPEYYIQPKNLLDNSDFTNVVDQLKVATTTKWSYFVDRWIEQYGGASVSYDKNGLKLTSTTNRCLYQRVANTDSLRGKTLTMATKVNGRIYCCSGQIGEYVESTSWITHADAGTVNGVRVAILEDDHKYVLAYISASVDITVEWAALYEGSYTAETLPPYVPKGYTAELLECQRYYLPLNPNSICFGSINKSSSVFYGDIFTPVPMNSVDLKIVTSDNNFGLTNNGTQIDITNVALAISTIVGNKVQITLNVQNKGVTASIVSKLWMTNGASAKIYLSSEI